MPVATSLLYLLSLRSLISLYTAFNLSFKTLTSEGFIWQKRSAPLVSLFNEGLFGYDSLIIIPHFVITIVR